jgi:ATP-dependent helicase Lhr and Lhr-like helicase
MSSIKLLERAVASAFYGKFPKLHLAQESAIEPLINGKNVVLSSGTGSGKTEAILAPIISRYWRLTVTNQALTILYIAPTKALVNDLEKRLYTPLNKLGLCVGLRHGDRDDLASGKKPHILITTPESLEVLIFRKDIALQTIQAVIIDEVHLLYNTQRGLQLSILLQRLKQSLARDIQWATLSATVGKLENIQTFLFGANENAIFLEFSAHRSIDAYVRHINDEITFLQLISKLTTGNNTKLLIFANSRRECERLASILQQGKILKLPIFTHYSSLSSDVRLETEQNFSQSRTAICISTSTLELGIDIGDIDAVILWDVPGNVESFLQRIGRSNRRQTKTNVICLIPDNSQNIIIDTLKFLALIDAAKKGELSIRSPYELFGAIGQQCLSIIASDNGRFTRIADLCKLFEHHDYLERHIIESICVELENNNYLQRHGFKNQYGADAHLYRLVDYRLIYGNFGFGSRTVELRYRSKVLGDVPADNLLKLRQGVLVRFSAQIWRVCKVSIESINVEPAQDKGSAIDFTYYGRGIKSDAFICNRIWQIIHSEELPFDILYPSLRKGLQQTINSLLHSCRCQQIPYNRSPQGIRYFTFGGYLVNKAIAILTKQLYYEVNDISLLVNVPINWELIPINPQAYKQIFHLLFEVSSEQSIYQTLLPPELQLHEFIQDWLKDETVAHILKRLNSSQAIEIQSSVLCM